MKVFLDTTYRRDKENDAFYRRIYTYIEKLGHKHLFQDIIKNAPLQVNDKLGKKERDFYVEIYRKRLEYLHQSDINVFEATIPSLSTGLLIEKSLDLNKPTIVFYIEDKPPILVSGMEEDKLILAPYNGNNLEEVVKKTFETAHNIKDKRFNFFISPGLLDYLESTSKEMGITKSTFIRKLIVRHMKNK